MAQHLDRKQRSPDRPDDGVDGVPGGIDPGNFVGEKFQEIEDASDGNDPGLAEDFERLVIRRENDPVLMDGEAGDEDGEVKIDARETGEPERHAQQVESFHGEISNAACDCHLVLLCVYLFVIVLVLLLVIEKNEIDYDHEHEHEHECNLESECRTFARGLSR
jgi:hypothetical protein